MTYAAQITATSAIESETIALLQGIKFALTHQFHQIIIEGDCSILTDTLQADGYLSWNLMYIWKQIKDHLKKLFSWKAQLYIICSANQSSHFFFFFYMGENCKLSYC